MIILIYIKTVTKSITLFCLPIVSVSHRFKINQYLAVSCDIIMYAFLLLDIVICFLILALYCQDIEYKTAMHGNGRVFLIGVKKNTNSADF